MSTSTKQNNTYTAYDLPYPNPFPPRAAGWNLKLWEPMRLGVPTIPWWWGRKLVTRWVWSFRWFYCWHYCHRSYLLVIFLSVFKHGLGIPRSFSIILLRTTCSHYVHSPYSGSTMPRSKGHTMCNGKRAWGTTPCAMEEGHTWWCLKGIM